jgi:hypothetical protein
MLTFALTLECENAAFENDPSAEVARILRKLADTLDTDTLREGRICRLHDSNGNFVGKAVLASAEDG